MPQAATLPAQALTQPHPHARKSARGRAHSHNTARAASIDERTAVLETRWETLTPELARKSDVRAAENRMTLWIFGAALALAGFCFAILSASETRMDKRIDALDARMDKLDARMDKLDARMDRLDARMDRLDAKLDAILAELRTQRRSGE